MNAHEEVVLRGDDLEVVLLPALGGRIHRLRAFGHDLVRTPGDPAAHRDEPFFWGAYVMAPWTNRASTSPMSIAGRSVDLAPNFPDGTAIHGQVYLAPWRQTGESSLAVARDGDGWPWAYSASADVTVLGSRLDLRYRLRNESDSPMPGGIGLHPWFRRPVEIALTASSVHPDNAAREAAHLPPSGRFALDGGPLPEDVDATWLDVEPPEITLRWPDLGLAARMTLYAGGAPVHVAVASPADLPAVAVEPVTHRPWALRRRADGEPGGMRLLAPGETLELAITLDFTRDAPPRTHLAAEERVWLDR